MGEGSHYSDELKIAALAHYDMDGRMTATAKAFSVPRNTLKKWIVDRENGQLTVKNAEARIASAKSDLISVSMTLMRKALDVIDRKLDQCSAPQAATVYGILHDKVAMMEGTMPGPGGNLTINNTYINQMPDQEAERLMLKAAERIRNRAIKGSFTVIPDRNNDGDNSGEPEI